MIARCQERGLNPGYALAADYPELGDGLLVALTEQRTREHIDRLAAALGDASPPSAARVQVAHDLNDNRLHADPEIEGHAPHGEHHVALARPRCSASAR